MIGKKIRERRLALGMTQEELAQKVGFKTKSAINKIEMDKNDVNQTLLVRIAHALECEPTFFIDSVPHKEYPSAAVMEYAKRLSALPPDMLDNVLQYIDFLEKRKGIEHE